MMPEEPYLKYLSVLRNGKNVIVSFAPEGNPEAITIDVFKQAIYEAGFGGYNIHQQSLESATAKYNSGEAFELIVGDAQDGKFSIRIDADLMSAYLSCSLPRGGAPVEMQAILQEAEKSGITVPLNLDAIQKALREGGNNILIASGRPPVPGVDGKFENLIPSIKEKSPQLDEQGLVNFRELGDIVIVHEKDALMQRILSTSGDPGNTITGKPFPIKPGKEVKFSTKLEGVVPDPNDPNRLIAAITGFPVLLKDGVSVEPVYTCQDVDLRTGNINYTGVVHITGDVQSGMSIKATGDIYVDGTVGSAVLEAGGDIVVKGGIIGSAELNASSDKDSHATITCTGSCTARFVQNARISAGSGIFINDTAMLCQLTAGHQVIVGDQGSRKGDIIGGTTRATMLVKAHNIGSPANIKTIVIAGADKLLLERLNINTQTREASERRLADISKLLELAQTSLRRLPPETVVTVTATRNTLNAEIANLRVEEIELKREFDIASRAQIVAGKHFFGGVEISIGAMHQRVPKDREGGLFCIREGKLVFV